MPDTGIKAGQVGCDAHEMFRIVLSKEAVQGLLAAGGNRALEGVLHDARDNIITDRTGLIPRDFVDEINPWQKDEIESKGLVEYYQKQDL